MVDDQQQTVRRSLRSWWTPRDSYNLMRGLGRGLVIVGLAQIGGYDLAVVWPALVVLFVALALMDFLVDRLFGLVWAG